MTAASRKTVFLALGWLAVLLPVFLSANFTGRFAVDVPFWDQWELVPVLRAAWSGTLTFSDLYHQHNEHRIFFPRLVMLALAFLTRWDVRFEMWFGWCTLVATASILFIEFKAERPMVRALVGFIPPSFLLFTLRQDENFLCGWQLQIFMAAFSMVLCLWLLLRPSPRRFWGAALAATVSSLSFTSGLACWPAGCVILLLSPGTRSERIGRLARWLVAGTVVLALYLHGWVHPGGHPAPGFFWHHPLQSLRFFTAMLGASLVRGEDVQLAVVVGGLLILACGSIFVAAARGQASLADARFGLSLVVSASIAAAMTTIGRAGFNSGPEGIGPALVSHYTTLTSLGVYGVYRALFALRPIGLRSMLQGGVIALIAVGSYLELYNGFSIGTHEAQSRLRMQQALRSFETADDADLRKLYPDATAVRRHASSLQQMGMSVFRPSAAN